MEFSHRKILPKPNAIITVEMGDDDYLYSHPPPPPSPPPTHHRHSHLTSPLVMLVFSLLGVAFIFISYLTISRRRRVSVHGSGRSGDNGGGGDVGLGHGGEDFFVDEETGLVVDHPIWFIRTVGLEQSVIDSIQVFKYSRGEKSVEGSGGCSVCLSEFEDDEELRLLPKCNHAFHVPCIDTWLRAHKNCPMCRAPVVSEDGNVTPVEPDSNEEGLGEARIDSDNAENVDQGGETASGETRDGNNHEVEDDEVRNVGHKISCYLNERVQSDLGYNRGGVEEEVQAIRRSVSMSSPSDSIIYFAMANVLPPIEREGCLDTQPVPTERPNPSKMEKVHKRTSSIMYKRVLKSSSFGRSMRRNHFLFKRSYSSSTSKRFETCHRGSQDSTLPF